MRTEPSFSAKSDDPAADNPSDNHEEFSTSQEASGDVNFDESSHLSDYRQRYGLSIDPFADDQHFPLYTGGHRRQILDQLLHLCQFSNNLLVVLGSYSVGKTRMAQALIDSLDDADDICFLEGQITSTFESLLNGVLTQFELPDVDTFNEFVKRQSDSDGLAVLIIDNAHHLTDEVLLELVGLIRSGPETRVHLVLFAESHLLPRLQALDVPDVVLSDFQLIKFSLAETVDYLNFRMEMADYLGPEIFTEANVEPWWRQSRGQLLELHEYAQEKLLASTSSSRKSVEYGKKSLPVPHIVGAAVLGAALIMGLIYLSGESTSSHKESQKITTIPIPKPAEQAVAASQVVVPESGNTNVVQASSIPETAGQNIVQQVEHEEAVTTLPASTTVENVAASSIAQAETAAVKESQVVKQSVVPLVQTNSMPQSIAEKTVKSSAAPAVKEVKKSDVLAEKEVAKKIEAQPQSQSVEKTKSTSVAASTAVGGNYSEQEKILLSWNESDFTLQLVGLSSEKAVNDFVAAQPNKKDLLVFKSLRQGKDWFVVVTGRYPSSAKAHQAAQLLPESQKKATPWSRDLKTIQREIRAR